MPLSQSRRWAALAFGLVALVLVASPAWAEEPDETEAPTTRMRVVIGGADGEQTVRMMELKDGKWVSVEETTTEGEHATHSPGIRIRTSDQDGDFVVLREFVDLVTQDEAADGEGTAEKNPMTTMLRWFVTEHSELMTDRPLEAWFAGDDVPLQDLRDAFKADGWDAKSLKTWVHKHLMEGLHAIHGWDGSSGHSQGACHGDGHQQRRGQGGQSGCRGDCQQRQRGQGGCRGDGQQRQRGQGDCRGDGQQRQRGQGDCRGDGQQRQCGEGDCHGDCQQRQRGQGDCHGDCRQSRGQRACQGGCDGHCGCRHEGRSGHGPRARGRQHRAFGPWWGRGRARHGARGAGRHHMRTMRMHRGPRMQRHQGCDSCRDCDRGCSSDRGCDASQSRGQQGCRHCDRGAGRAPSQRPQQRQRGQGECQGDCQQRQRGQGEGRGDCQQRRGNAPTSHRRSAAGAHEASARRDIEQQIMETILEEFLGQASRDAMQASRDAMQASRDGMQATEEDVAGGLDLPEPWTVLHRLISAPSAEGGAAEVRVRLLELLDDPDVRRLEQLLPEDVRTVLRVHLHGGDLEEPASADNDGDSGDEDAAPEGCRSCPKKASCQGGCAGKAGKAGKAEAETRPESETGTESHDAK